MRLRLSLFFFIRCFSDRITVTEYLQVWLDDYVLGTVEDSTWHRYEQIVRKHLCPDLGSLHLNKLTAGHVQSLYSRKLKSGLSARSVQYIHRTIRKALKQAVGFGFVTRNVTDHVKPPSPDSKELQCLSAKQIAELLEQAKRDRFYALFVLAAETGLWQGELLGLRWKDIDLDMRTTDICQKLEQVRGGGFKFSKPKTQKSHRKARITPYCAAALRDHHKQQLEARLKRSKTWEDYSLVFTSKTGTPVNPRNLLRRHFEPLLKAAELPKVRFHDLRHSFATILLSEGVYIKIVQKMLGHSRTSTTLDFYSRALPDQQDAAVAVMEQLFG